jgi:ubiquinone/menaquinone biosynthesis C-methylase UbiE
MAFYAGPYRKIAASFHPSQQLYDQIQEIRVKNYADRLSKWLAERKVECSSILDAGGSTGTVGETIRQRLNPTARLTVLDPCASELSPRHNTKTLQTTIEDMPRLDSPDPYDLVLCCQTADHLVDPLRALANLRIAASSSAYLVIDILDVRRARVYKIDHPCRWSTQALYAALTKTGWMGTHHEILDRRHQLVLARPL